MLKRRADARDRRTKKEQALAERAKDRKQEMDRDALRKQMALDETERTTVDDRKDSEKKLAEEDMYAKFREVRSCVEINQWVRLSAETFVNLHAMEQTR